MTNVELATLASIVLSLVFSYFPKLNTWFAALEGNVKRLIMLGLILVTALVAFGLSCWAITAGYVPAVTCDVPGAKGLFEAFVLAVLANQATYLVSPTTKAVKEAKAG